MSALGDWQSTFGGILDAKASLLASQATDALANAGLRRAQAEAVPIDSESNAMLRAAQGAGYYATANKTNADAAEVPANDAAERAYKNSLTTGKNISNGVNGVFSSLFKGRANTLGGSFLDGLLYKKDGGPVGKGEDYRGKDTIPAKLAPGEFVLTKEAVDAIGGGNNEQGMRHLSSMMAQLTGKQAGNIGPGEPGLRHFQTGGGEPVPGRNIVVVPGTGNNGYTPNWTIPEPQAAAPEFTRAQRWANTATNMGQSVGEAMRQPVVQDAVAGAKTAAKVGVPVALAEWAMPRHQEFFNDPAVSNWDKVKQFTREAVGEVAGVGTGAVGAGAGSVATPIVGTVAGGIGGYMAGKGVAHGLMNAALGDSPAAQYEAKMRADGKTPQLMNRGVFGDADKPVPKEPEATPEQQKAAAAEAAARAAAQAKADETERGLRQAHGTIFLAALAGNQGAQAYIHDRMTSSNSGASSLLAREKEVGDMLSKRYQTPVYDDAGKVKSYTENPEAVNQVKDMLAQKGINLAGMTQDQQNAALRDVDRLWRAQSNFNEAVRGELGDKGERSNDLRGLRVQKGISFADAFLHDRNAVSWKDYLKAKWAGNNDLDNMLVIDAGTRQNPGSGQTVPDSKVFVNDGMRDRDAFLLHGGAQKKDK